MTITYWLKTAEAFLLSRGILTARLDCLILLEDTLGVDRARLLAEPDMEVSEPQVAPLQKLLSRRAAHEPLAYISGKTEFYGRTFTVSEAVLEPRPESETMIDMLKKLDVFSLTAKTAFESDAVQSDTTGRFAAKMYAKRPIVEAHSKQNKPVAKNQRTVRIADVGAGSGALGITAALELPNSSVDLLEIDPAALQIAKTNVDLFTLNISTIKTDLLTDSPQDYDILLCNLPYVPDTHTINQAAHHEPSLAIFGGPDGLDLYHRLFKQLSKQAKRPLYILTESLPPQHAGLAAIASKHGYKLVKTDDFIQAFKITA